jgi:hypothetical protein
MAMDAVEAALNSWWPNHGDRDWANGPRDDRLWYEKMSRALAAADAARGRDAEVNAPAWTAAKERALRQLVFLQPRATATDAERQLWSEIRREAFPEKSDE